MTDVNDVTGVVDGAEVASGMSASAAASSSAANAANSSAANAASDSAAAPGDRKSGEHGHVPVLLDRVTALLEPGITAVGSPDGTGAVVVDGTLGAGGHAEHLL